MPANIHRRQVIAARALLDWTQPDLARAAHIARATLQRYECGHSTPIPAVLAALIRALEHAGITFVSNGVKINRLPR